MLTKTVFKQHAVITQISTGPPVSDTPIAIEVSDAYDGDHVGLVDADANPITFEVETGLSLDLDVWCYGQDLDVILQRLGGYTDAGNEVWLDVGDEVALTAAASKNSAVAVAAAIASLYSDNIRSGTYRIAAQLAADTAPGYLHFHGVVKS